MTMDKDQFENFLKVLTGALDSGPCPYALGFTQEEIDGLDWLYDTLEAIGEKGPKHRSFDKAHGAACALNKLNEYVHRMHSQAHDLEGQLEAATTLTTVKRAEA